MGLAKLMKATVIFPRAETQQVVSKLAELEWIHTLPNSSEHSDPLLDDLMLKAQKVYQDIDDVTRALNIPLETGVIDTMFKGAPKGKTEYVINDIQNFVADLEDRGKLILDEPKKVIVEQNTIAKQLEEYRNVESALKLAADLNLNLTLFRALKYFYAEIFIIDSKDLVEIQRSLGDLQVFTNKLSDDKTSIVVVGASEESERIVKVLRGFGIHPIQIPVDTTQNPSIAYSEAHAKVKELEASSTEIGKKIQKLRKANLIQILSLHEAAKAAKDVLEITRRPGGTRNFALINGYIPEKMQSKFKNLTKNYISIVEDAGVHSLNQGDQELVLPTLLSNKKYIRTFEVITETQGIPRTDEVDPTPIIAFVWPLFFGLMFADLGHGLLLFGLGMLLRQRGNGSITTWGTLIAASGAAAAIAGLGTGEVFGFHILGIAVLAPITSHIPFIGVLNISELTFAQVVKILKVSVAIGIVHLLMAFFLRLHKDIKDGNKLFVWTHDIPNIIQFLAIVSLVLAAIGSQYDIIGMFGVAGHTHTEPVPWLSFTFGRWVTVDIVAKAAVPVILATVAIMIYGGWKEQKEAAKHGHDEGGGIMGVVIEVILVRIVEMLSNIISYSRIGIMLLVHSALLVTVNQSYLHGGGLAVLIGGNIGIMLIEGLIVYIQTIRLHLYEWFPKWYIGEGVEFKKLVPAMLYSNVIWKSGKEEATRVYKKEEKLVQEQKV
ncbi:MAG: V-type ATPase 116kDa subunit family protein [Nitrososphaeraceae archaeon]